QHHLVPCLVAMLAAGTAIMAFGHVPAAAAQPKAKTYDVRVFRDITYYQVRNDPDAARHKLDVYRPAAKGQYPLLLFLHGGAWVTGSKDDVFGWYGYGTIARCLAERGLVVVLPNYRLSPGVRHPEHIKDVSRAFAWAYQKGKEYGGDRDRFFVGGHSAGGHLAALLATDETYLKAVGHRTKQIRGVIGVSGVYRLDGFDVKLLLADRLGIFSGKVEVRPLAFIFSDKAVRQASPFHHVRRGLPPFLLLTGGWDYAPMRRMAKQFSAALKKYAVPVQVKEIPWRTHETLLFDILHLSVDSASRDAIVHFIDRYKPKEK
ncbi:MAG TPA: alpha/beta hydrolase, partial [Gemmataceae bacterium]|nr:alpha/beta hydrolase [Gemmataceae bacterium]